MVHGPSFSKRLLVAKTKPLKLWYTIVWLSLPIVPGESPPICCYSHNSEIIYSLLSITYMFAKSNHQFPILVLFDILEIFGPGDCYHSRTETSHIFVLPHYKTLLYSLLCLFVFIKLTSYCLEFPSFGSYSFPLFCIYS